MWRVCSVACIECGVWSVECRVWCSVWSLKWSVKCGVERIESGVWRAQCKVWSVERRSCRKVSNDVKCTIDEWLVVWNIFILPYIGNSRPNWLIFFRGVETTNQMSGQCGMQSGERQVYRWQFPSPWNFTKLWRKMTRMTHTHKKRTQRPRVAVPHNKTTWSKHTTYEAQAEHFVRNVLRFWHFVAKKMRFPVSSDFVLNQIWNASVNFHDVPSVPRLPRRLHFVTAWHSSKSRPHHAHV